MSRTPSQAGRAAAHGFGDPRYAAAQLGALSQLLEVTGTSTLVASLAESADPDLALAGIQRIAAQRPSLLVDVVADRCWLRKLTRVLGASVALNHHLGAVPDDVLVLADDSPPSDAATLKGRFAAEIEGPNPADSLRRAYHRQLLRIAGRDLASIDPIAELESVASELADTADATIEAALTIARMEVPDAVDVRLAVIALGKAGARELNYASDVDVMFVAEPAHRMDAATRLAGAMMRICSDHTAAGTIWPVDANLRPEGRSGPLVRSLDSMAAYYQQWAKNWEFQALLKARPMAGDLNLGREFVELVTPMVWRVGEQAHFVAEVQHLRRRVISNIPTREREREIKLGAGGLRDTEFSVQLLQLVHGRADERLRLAATLPALDALVEHGYVGRTDGAELASAYRFQRVLEHRVQLYRLRRTHLVPTDEVVLRSAARSMGFQSGEELVERWRASTRSVQRLRRRMFYSPVLDAVARIPTEQVRLTSAGAETRLRALDYLDPVSALRHIKALTQGISRRTEIQRQLLPAMLGWLAEGPSPDHGLLAFRQVSEALGDTAWYLRALRDADAMAENLARILASSRLAVDLLLREPQAVRLLADAAEITPRAAPEIGSEMAAVAGRQQDAASRVTAIRAVRRRELLRLAIGDLLGAIDQQSLGAGLAELTSATINSALDAVASEVPQVPELAVIALGSWGGQEQSYGSDADALVVMADSESPDAVRAATTLVVRVRDLLSSPGPEPGLVIDLDLRPEGRGGAMVRSRASHIAYYERWASTWEAQALLRAGHGAGNGQLSTGFLSGIDPLRYPVDGVDAHGLLEIRKLKARMEAERARGADPKRNIKLGPGGLSDVEWTVQLLQLQHAGRHPALRATRTMQALREAAASGLLAKADADALADAWQSASRLRNAITLFRGRASDLIPTDVRELSPIAILMGYAPGESSQLLEDYARRARLARQVMDKVFWAKDR